MKDKQFVIQKVAIRIKGYEDRCLINDETYLNITAEALEEVDHESFLLISLSNWCAILQSLSPNKLKPSSW